MASMTGLLISVRDAAEARAALAGGADVIDVKEPSRGPLGRADDVVVAAVRDAVPRAVLLTAALGELREFQGKTPRHCDLVKCGPAGFGDVGEWREHWLRFRDDVGTDRAVIVAYADWRCAAAVPFDDILNFACEQPTPTMLIDTGCKERSVGGRRASLLDWLPVDWLAAAANRIHAAGGRIALAGSLRDGDIEALVPLRPDWIAVRGAACVDGDRDASIDAARVAAIKTMLQAG